jgi:hypothetical protein
MSIAPPNHTRTAASVADWITPQWLLDQLGPCACIPQPWPCAAKSYTREDDGLSKPWNGLVWCNPPYGRETGRWLARMAEHDSGIALVFARVETRMFFSRAWPRASAVLFLKGRLTLNRPDGSAPPLGANSGGPSVLIAYGAVGAERLKIASDLGVIMSGWRTAGWQAIEECLK